MSLGTFSLQIQALTNDLSIRTGRQIRKINRKKEKGGQRKGWREEINKGDNEKDEKVIMDARQIQKTKKQKKNHGMVSHLSNLITLYQKLIILRNNMGTV